jgi:hypothetical protein
MQPPPPTTTTNDPPAASGDIPERWRRSDGHHQQQWISGTSRPRRSRSKACLAPRRRGCPVYRFCRRTGCLDRTRRCTEHVPAACAGRSCSRPLPPDSRHNGSQLQEPETHRLHVRCRHAHSLRLERRLEPSLVRARRCRRLAVGERTRRSSCVPTFRFIFHAHHRRWTGHRRQLVQARSGALQNTGARESG